MTDKPLDPLDRDVSLKARIDASGIEVGAKSRFAAAIDYLFGGLVDLAGGYVGGRAERHRMARDGEAQRMQAELDTRAKAQAIVDQAKLDVLANRARHFVEQAAKEVATLPPEDSGNLLSIEAARVLLGNSVRESARQLNNQLTVVAEALEELEGSPEPSAGKAEGQPRKDQPEHDGFIQEDWLNVFGDYAKRASSENMRMLWGRILAGEARKPGAFSLATLRFAAELDRETAVTFEKILPKIVLGAIYPRPGDLKGQDLADLLALEEAGLISAATGGLQMNYRIGADGKHFVVGTHWGLEIQGTPDKSLGWPMSRLTRTGRELAAVLFNGDERPGFRAVADLIKQDVTAVNLIRVVSQDENGQLRYDLVERLHPAS